MNVYLVGPPNVGKSTIYAKITQHYLRPWIANISGSTRSIESSKEVFGQLIDTPGLEHLYVPQASWVEDIRQDSDAVLLYVMSAKRWLPDAAMLEQWRLLDKPMAVLVMHTDALSYCSQAVVDLQNELGLMVQLSHYQDDGLPEKFNVSLLSLSRRSALDYLNGTLLDDAVCAQIFSENRLEHDVELMEYWLNKAYRLWAPLTFRMQTNHEWSTSVDRWLWRSRYAGLLLGGGMITLLLALILSAQIMSSMIIDALEVCLHTVQMSVQKPYLLQTMHGLLIWVALLPSIVMARGFTSLIEHSGLGQRMMVIGHKMFRRLRLPVHAWVPLMMSFNCNVVAMDLIADMEPRSRARLAYLLPMVPCSARWTVGVILTSVLPAWQAVSVLVFGYCLSLSLVVLIAAWTVDSGSVKPQAIALTPLCWPRLRLLAVEVGWSSFNFIRGLLKWLLPVQLLMNVLMTLTMQGVWTFDVGESILAEMAKRVVWIFYPMGLSMQDWPWISGLLPGLFAKEAMVSVWLPMSHAMHAEHDPLVIMSFLAWSWLYVPCLGTVYQMRRFVGGRAWLYTIFTFTLGYLMACLIAQGYGIVLIVCMLVLLKLSLYESDKKKMLR